MIQKNEVPSFEGLGIADNILVVLKENNFVSPTPIQHQVIPAAIEGRISWVLPKQARQNLGFGIPRFSVF
jgi:superfamily II DNA/RNA helicase